MEEQGTNPPLAMTGPKTMAWGNHLFDPGSRGDREGGRRENLAFAPIGYHMCRM